MPVANRPRSDLGTVLFAETGHTPVRFLAGVWLKRDDLWTGAAPARGGKSRTAELVCRRALRIGIKELCVAVDRNSSVPSMLSRVCRHYWVKLHLWLPASKEPLPKVFEEAKANGAVLEEVRPGYMTVRRKKIREYIAASSGTAVEVGLGLLWEGCGNEETAFQTANVQELFDRKSIKRVVVPVGSGGMLRGVITGLRLDVPILGVCCGTPPEFEMPPNVQLVKSSKSFHDKVGASICDVVLDPVYEAKCVEFLREGDLLWIVAHRDTQ